MGRIIQARDIATATGAQGPKVCVRRDENSIAEIPTWKAFTGSDPDYIHAFAWPDDTRTWETIVEWTEDICAAYEGYKLTWAVPLATPTESMANFAAGNYDNYFKAMLDRILEQNPDGPIYIRPGWEPNGPTSWPWNASNGAHAAYISAFQRASGMIKRRSPRFRVEWCVTHDGFSSGGVEYDATNPTTGCYPGDDYVDCVSVDFYMIGATISNNYTWQRNCQATEPHQIIRAGYEYGLKHMADFARAHNKPMTIPELGIGAELPAAWREMARFILDPYNNVEYYGVWDKNAEVQVGGLYDGKFKFPCQLTPNADHDYVLSKAAYLYYFKGIGAPVTEQAETGSFIARSRVTVSTTWRALYDEFYARAKRAGILNYSDAIFLPIGPDSEITRLGLITPGGFTTIVPNDTTKLLEVNSPTFEAVAGSPVGASVWRGNGSNSVLRANGLNLGATPALADLKFSRDSAHMGLWALDATNNGGVQAAHFGSPTSNIGINATGRWVGRPNTTTGVGGTQTIGASTDGAGNIMWHRTGPSAWAGFFNGVANGQSGATASVDPSNDDVRLLGIPSLSQFTTNRLLAAYLGGGLPLTGPLNMPLRIHETLSWLKAQVAP